MNAARRLVLALTLFGAACSSSSGGGSSPDAAAGAVQDTAVASDTAASDTGQPAGDTGTTFPPSMDAGIIPPAPDVGAVDPPGSELCPPAGPFGTGVGDTMGEVVLKDCDDNPVSLSSLCSHKASFIFSFAGW